MPKMNNNAVLSSKFALALQFANEIHGAQVRKGIQAPYISHLMAVCALVLEYGGDETQAISALLHDSAEDCGGRPMLETVRVLFGDNVAKIVEACTDTFDDPKPAWRPRKEAYLALMALKPASAKLVACADKFHNLGHTLRDIEIEGVTAWKNRMKQTPNGGAEKQVWYYLGCLTSLSNSWTHPILAEYGRAVARLCSLVGTSVDVSEANTLLASR